MTATDDAPRCERADWCAFDPGHEGGCSLIRPRQVEALAELSRELEAVLVKIRDAWREAAPVIMRQVKAAQTPKDFTLHPNPKENPDDRPQPD